MATKGSIIFAATLAWVGALTTFFTTGNFFNPYGIIFFFICSAAITGAGYYYCNTINQKHKRQYPKPFKPITPEMVKKKKIFFAIFTSIEAFEGILALLVGYFGFQFLIDVPTGIVIESVLAQLQVSLTILVIIGILLLIDGLRRFCKEIIMNR